MNEILYYEWVYELGVTYLKKGDYKKSIQYLKEY